MELKQLGMQHMADNTLYLLKHLSAPDSPLPTLTEGYTRPTIVFFQFFTHFFVFDFSTAQVIYATFLALSVVLVWQTYVDPSPALKSGTNIVVEQLKGIIAISSAIVGGLAGSNIVAFLMQRVLDKGMSWFAEEYSTVALYGPATLTGLFIQYIVYVLLMIAQVLWHRNSSLDELRNRRCSLPYCFSRLSLHLHCKWLA